MLGLLRLAIAAAFLFAPAAHAASADSTERLLDLLGFRAMADYVGRSFEGMPEAAEGQFAPEVVAKWPAIIADRIDPDRVYSAAATAVAERMSEEEVAALTDFFATDAGRRITAAEEAMQMIDDPAVLAEAQADYLAGLDDSFRDRFALYQDLIDALGSVDSGTALVMNINFAMVSGMVASGLMDPVPTDEEILAMIAQSEGQIRDMIYRTSIETMAYTYRDIPDADMRAYVDLLASDDGRKLYAVVNQVINDIVISAARDIGHAIMVEMGKREL